MDCRRLKRRIRGWCWCLLCPLMLLWLHSACIPSLQFPEGQGPEPDGETLKTDASSPEDAGDVSETPELAPEAPIEDAKSCRPSQCITPPGDSCKDGTTLLEYESPGTCDPVDDKCVYKVVEKKCPEICKGDACTSLCAQKSCMTPSPPKCDKGNLIVYKQPGSCVSGTCEYPSTTTQCPYGCNQGKCLPRPACLDVDCKTPPKPTCANASTLRTYKVGSCKGDQCSYGYTDKSCPVGCSNGACRPVTSYTPLTPQLLLDSRKSGGKLGADGVKCWDVTTKKVPSDAKAVFVTVTSVQSAASGYISMYPRNPSAPSTPSKATAVLTYKADDVIANGAIVAMGPKGYICLYTEQSTHVIVFLRGYFGATTGYHPISLSRVFDSRRTSGKPGAGSATCSGSLTSKGVVTTAKAAFFTTSALQGGAQGYLTAYQKPSRPADLAQVNYAPGDNATGGAIVPPGSGREVCVYTLSSAHLILDVFGYFASYSTYTPLSPSRPVSVRSGNKPSAGTSKCHSLNAKGNIIPSTAKAVALHVGAISAADNGYMQVYYPDAGRVDAANVNFKKGESRVAFAIVRPNKSANVCVYLSQSAYYVIDVVGYWK